MDSTVSYKYINLLFRLMIGLGAIWFIVYKLKDDLLSNIEQIESVNYRFLGIVFILVFVNWGLESLKWKYAIRNELVISFGKAFNATITGITAGLLTPNRIGEIPFRALMLGKDNFKPLLLRSIVSSFSQLMITVLSGAVGLYFTLEILGLALNAVALFISLLVLILFMLLIYFKIIRILPLLEKIRFLRKQNIGKALSNFSSLELFNLLILSFLRYVVFFVQYILVLKAFGVDLITFEHKMLIPVVFLIASIIPTILISEIGVRGSVALFVVGLVSDMDVAIITGSIVLWLFNVGVPAIIGLVNLKQIKLMGK